MFRTGIVRQHNTVQVRKLTDIVISIWLGIIIIELSTLRAINLTLTPFLVRILQAEQTKVIQLFFVYSLA